MPCSLRDHGAGQLKGGAPAGRGGCFAMLRDLMEVRMERGCLWGEFRAGSNVLSPFLSFADGSRFLEKVEVFPPSTGALIADSNKLVTHAHQAKQIAGIFGPCNCLRTDIHLFYGRCVSSWMPTVSMAVSGITLRVERINGYTTELMETLVEAPKQRVVFIPGNPGIIPFYKSYFEALAQNFGGKASITGIGYLGHSCKDLQKGKLFSLEEQVEHKVQLVQKIAAEDNTPLVLVGHSIGAHMALCVFKKFPDKVRHVVALYPFLATNEKSSFQSFLKWSLRQAFLCEALAYFAGFMGLVPDILGLGDAYASSELWRAWDLVSDHHALVFFDPRARVNSITQLAEKMEIKVDEMGRLCSVYGSS
ncbi:hypothetical protein L7F22_034570 [Adiantum nelumboides]|nr:hypothetical protein [Adiantum nelumboides]